MDRDALLREWLAYNPDTGVFTHIAARPKVRVGDVAGTLHARGYVIIRHRDRTIKAHRLAWYFVYGEWPPTLIDHVNGIKSDNRICNLRLATKSQNGVNRAYHPMKGIRYHRRTAGDRWVVRFKKDRKYVHVGTFYSLSDAQAAYKAALVEHFGEFARLR